MSDGWRIVDVVPDWLGGFNCYYVESAGATKKVLAFDEDELGQKIADGEFYED